MISALFGLTFAILVATAFSTVLFGTVDKLPYGIDEALVVFMEQVNIVINLIPPLGTIWEVFIIAITVKIGLLVIYYTMWFIELIRG